ncbi:MAG: CHAT domain-containing protein [Saprospiraceae bacterium]|nr:CHAT domain-containing protein [Saprospiraceae bacterium]
MTLKLPTLASLLLAALLTYPMGTQAQQVPTTSLPLQIQSLQDSTIRLAKAKDWETYIVVQAKILSLYKRSGDLLEGIEFGENLLQKITRRAGRFKSSSWSVYQALASLYATSGKTDRAIALHLEQLDLLSSYPKSVDPWRLIATYNQLGAQHLAQRETGTAFSYLQQAKSHLQLHLKDTGFVPSTTRAIEVITQTYALLSEYHVHTYDLQEALPYAKLALQTAKQHYATNAFALHPHYNRIGKLYFALEEYEKSQEYHRKALYVLKKGKLQETVADSTQVALAYYYSDLADAFGGKEAINYYEKSLNLLEKPEEHLLLRIKNLRKIAEHYNWQEDFDRSWSYIEQADSLWLANVEQYQQDIDFQFSRAGIYRSRGHYWKRLGSFEKSLHFYKKYVEVWERNGSSPVNTESIGILMEIAEIYNWKVTEKEMYADSAVYYTRKALVKATKNFNSYDLKEIPRVEDLHTITYMYAILKQLARFGQWKATHYGDIEDEREALHNALAIMDLADQFHTRSLQQINNLRAGQAASLIKRSLMIYHGSIVFATSLYEIEPSAELIEKCFYYSQRMKAQKLWLEQLEEEAHQLLDLPDSIQIQEKAMAVNIQDYKRQILDAQRNGDTVLVEEIRNNQLFETYRTSEALQLQLEEDNPSFLRNKYDFVPTTIAELQEQLAPEELLIEYMYSGWKQLAFVVQKDMPAQLSILTQEESVCNSVYQHIELFHDLLQRSPMLRKSSRADFIQWSNLLYQHFLRPIEKSLVGKKRLIVVGYDRINYIPFETLLASAEMKPFTDLEFLIKRYEVSYHYSANLFVQSRKKRRPVQEGVYVFAPIYDDQAILAATPVNTKNTSKHTALRAFDEDGVFTPLPESEREANDIFKLFTKGKDPIQNKLALREVATEHNLKANLEAPYRFIHIAGHSFANLKNPEFSGIACFTKDSSIEEDGILYMGEIYALDTYADLVTLSSCESGLGKLERSDGLIGLNRAFVYTGIPNVVFSLWKVYDRVSSNLMVDFYGAVLAGENYATSLRRAKLKLLESEATASPHYWSPFLLIGR